MPNTPKTPPKKVKPKNQSKSKLKTQINSQSKEKIITSYGIVADEVRANVSITIREDEYIPKYTIKFPSMKQATEAILKSVHDEIIRTVNITPAELLDPKLITGIKDKFMNKANEILIRLLPTLPVSTRNSLVGSLVHNMFGLGVIELLLKDDFLEEIVINTSSEKLWVYHKEYGWLITNLDIPEEKQIQNYSSIIGRRVGRQINNLDPLMDAHLLTGDRVNATLFPISTKGNTITIRKFARHPWTITDLIDPKSGTLSKEVAAFLWMCIQYELNIIIGGGTASGKTSFLNALAPFIPVNNRIISIEDTRELRLPDFAHWVPMTSRESNTEGKGEITMLDLMLNSLRMRPDRILVGEVRKKNQAEVMLEAMHTGHSVYSTLHANTSDEVKTRLTTPPISLPESQLDAIHLTVIQFRHRRKGIRRTLQVSEFISTMKLGDDKKTEMNTLYQWNPETDKIEKVGESMRIFGEISSFTGMNPKQIIEDLAEKEQVLQWLLDNNIRTINSVGKVIAEYYNNKEKTMDLIKNKAKPEKIIPADMLEELKGYMDTKSDV